MSNKVKSWILFMAYLIIGMSLLYVFEEQNMSICYYLVIVFLMFCISTYLVFGKYKSFISKDTIGLYHIVFYNWLSAILNRFANIDPNLSLLIAFSSIIILYLLSFLVSLIKSKLHC